MLERKCKICCDVFYAKPNWVARGWGKYCSMACCHKSQENGELVQCFMCSKKVYRTKQQLRRSKSKKYFCGKSCQTLWRNTVVFIGENHANWIDGKNAYRNVMFYHKVSPACKICNIDDKRVLAVHHIDKNRRNNKINNLAWLCRNCHYLVHHNNAERKRLKIRLGKTEEMVGIA